MFALKVLIIHANSINVKILKIIPEFLKCLDLDKVKNCHVYKTRKKLKISDN